MKHRIDSVSIHAGQPNDEQTGAVTCPIYQTSTFSQVEPGVTKGFNYSRTAVARPRRSLSGKRLFCRRRGD